MGADLSPPPPRLLHYAKKPVPQKLRDRQQEIEMKPRGLWLSVEGEDDWPHWCRGEGFAIDRLGIVTEVVLLPEASILQLSSAADIDAFTCEWVTVPPGLPDSFLAHGTFIDWPGIAREYDGIIIAPYIWERRLSGHCAWYYGWDCASGCIWRAAAIADLRPVLA